MAITTFNSEVNWTGKGVQSIAKINQHEVVIDEPVSLGGQDEAPNPVEYLLAGLGGCINVLVTSFAPAYGVEVEGLRVNVAGDLDPDGFLGKNPDVRVGYQEIRYEISLDSPSAQENIDKLLEHVENVCPVKDTLSGTKVISQTVSKVS